MVNPIQKFFGFYQEGGAAEGGSIRWNFYLIILLMLVALGAIIAALIAQGQHNEVMRQMRVATEHNDYVHLAHHALGDFPKLSPAELKAFGGMTWAQVSNIADEPLMVVANHVMDAGLAAIIGAGTGLTVGLLCLWASTKRKVFGLKAGIHHYSITNERMKYHARSDRTLCGGTRLSQLPLSNRGESNMFSQLSCILRS